MPGERRIKKRDIRLPWVLFIAFFVLATDQITKLIFQNLLSLDSSTPLVKNIFHLTLIFNKGAAFGIFKTQTAIFIILGLICIIFMIFYMPRLKEEAVFVKIGFGSILGGIIGNLIDRLRFGYVVDFLDFRIWPVFNIADSAITIGAALIILHLLKQKKYKAEG